MRSLIILLTCVTTSTAWAQSATGYDDWHRDAPGVVHQITPGDLPAPYASGSAGNGPRVVARPPGAAPHVPAGFTAQIFATGLQMPRVMRVAPNGDIFLAESGADRIRVFPVADPAHSVVFTTDVSLPYGIAFYPPGPNPQWVYIGEGNQISRFPYHVGDTKAAGAKQIILPDLPVGGHWTRDVVAAPDGQHLFVSVGSASNVASGLSRRTPQEVLAWEAAHGKGAAWDAEAGRADVLQLDPAGHEVHVYATGLRNCSGETIDPGGNLWCATNERDGLGDNLPPDYVTRVQPGGFYGWPWFYIGDHEDPRHAGERPDLRSDVTVPDVLLQPHSAPLGIVFYAGGMFPPAWRGDAFVALHGSWNRALRTGYKVVRVRMQDGKPTSYEDFMTGFIVSDSAVWGRPVDVAVDRDGALLVSEDGNGTIWRITKTAGE